MNIDTWQKGYAELSRQFANLKKENLAMKDELIKLRRTYEDQIDNLTLDNMPSVREIAIKTKDGVAGLVITVDETVKSVKILTETVTEQGNSIASFESRASDLEAGIISIAEVQTAQGRSIAAIEQTANELGAEVVLAAEMATAANDNVSNGAYIIARVNEDASNVKIKADKVEIEGLVTFSDLKKAGETTINGANIKTGTISGGGNNSGAWNLDTGEFSAGNGNFAINSLGDVSMAKGKVIVFSDGSVFVDGYATIESLGEKGGVNINGANITAGTITTNKIAVGENGTIDFTGLGSLDFATPLGAYGSIRLNENEYGAGEIIISADMNVAVSGGGANFYLNEDENGGTEARIYANKFVMNGKRGVSGTYSIGGGSITVENGVVTKVVEGGGSTPINLQAPVVSVNGESASFNIYNPNGKGTTYYRLSWFDDFGEEWTSDLRESDDASIFGYFDNMPPYGGCLAITAWVEFDGHTSSVASANDILA